MEEPGIDDVVFTLTRTEFVQTALAVEVALTFVDDAIVEADEELSVILERFAGLTSRVALRLSDGTTSCGSSCPSTVTIADDDGAPEPDDDEVSWKTSVTVGNMYFRNREWERGWRLHACMPRLEEGEPEHISDRADDDYCYGRIADRDFEVDGTTYELEGVYHFVAHNNDTLRIDFTEEVDISALLNRELIIDGRKYPFSHRYSPRGNRARTIGWSAPRLTATTGWTVGSRIWLGLGNPPTSRVVAAPTVSVTRIEEGPIHGPFEVRFEFSEDVTGFEAAGIVVENGNLVEDSLTEADARTWTARVAPAGSGTVSVSVPADAAQAGQTGNAASEALMVEADVSVPAVTVTSTAPVSGPFTVRVTFSKPVTGLSMDDLTIEGGTATGMLSPVSEPWYDVLVTPQAGAAEVAVTVPVGVAQDAAGRGNAASETLRIAVAVSELTASFHDVPETHDGETAFKFELHFAEEVQGLSYRTLRDSAFTVTNGTVIGARRKEHGRNLRWAIIVAPDGLGDVIVALPATTDCEAVRAICTSSGKKLSKDTTETVHGPLALSVADARAEEGTDGAIDFTVALSRAGSETVTVDYTTADGTATAGQDYTATSGTLTFSPGETEKTVSVPLLDDAVDEGEETLTLRLSNAAGARIVDAEAAGTISNTDPVQKMWLSRFSRTAADHVVDAVSDRLSGPLSGTRVTLGGQSIDLARSDDGTALARAVTGIARVLGAQEVSDRDGGVGRGAWTGGGFGRTWDYSREAGVSSPGMTGAELLTGSSFHVASGGNGSGSPEFAAWGRVSVGGFDGEAPDDRGTVAMDGEVRTVTLGADASHERWVAGLAVSRSEGEGGFAQADAGHRGRLESSITAVHPYVGIELTDRLSAWGLLGWGSGDTTITEAANDNRGEVVTRTDIDMRLGATGVRGALVQPSDAGGLDVGIRADAFLVQTDWDRVSGETDTRAESSRLRLVLDGSRAFGLGEGSVLTPGLEFGIRHDGGGAEIGTGAEVGVRIAWADPSWGLGVQAAARRLIAHEASGYEEWGASGSIRFEPDASGRGLSFSLAPIWGMASSGVERLWSRPNARALEPGRDFEAARSVEAQVGYGLGAFGGHGLMTPYASLSVADGSSEEFPRPERPGRPACATDIRWCAHHAGGRCRAACHALEKRGLLLRDDQTPCLDLESVDEFEHLLAASVHYYRLLYSAGDPTVRDPNDASGTIPFSPMEQIPSASDGISERR